MSKDCPDCGLASIDDAIACDCGYDFSIRKNPLRPEGADTDSPPFSTRLGTIAGLWVFAMVAAAPDPKAAPYLLVFPAGLVAPIGFFVFGFGGWVALLWVGYIALTGFVLAQQERRPYFKWLIVLAVVLSLNVVGCHMSLSSLHD